MHRVGGNAQFFLCSIDGNLEERASKRRRTSKVVYADLPVDSPCEHFYLGLLTLPGGKLPKKRKASKVLRTPLVLKNSSEASSEEAT